jgi:hypothetical protein
MCSGDEQLDIQLVTNYFKLLGQENELPYFIVLYNGGVKLACTGSPALESMQELAN